jgi:hypothetical protein
MTKTEVITLIGDLLTRLDVKRGSLPTDDPKSHVLDAIRNELDDRQRVLTRAALQENTEQYKTLTAKLTDANKDLKTTLDKLDKFVETLDAMGRILAAVDSLIKTAVSVII